MTVKFMSLASGSSGNCYYLATDSTAILVDAGIGIRTIKKVFKERMLNLEEIQAVLVTHDHADHIKAVGHLGEKHGIPVYTTPEIHEGMKHSYCMTERLKPERTRFIQKEETFNVGDFTITCFEVPHDGTDNVGYCITTGDKTFSFLTDIGHITPTAARFIQQADYLILEANYDDSMLQMGPYPQHLKERIAGPNGHMSNHEMADYLSHHFPQHLKHLWLCHLSKDNNHPELAFKTVELAFRQENIIAGKDVEVTPLRRTTPSEMYILE